MSEIPHNLFDELDVANHITLRRIYDTLLVLLRTVDPEGASKLAQLHEAGHFASPEVAYAEEQDEEHH